MYTISHRSNQCFYIKIIRLIGTLFVTTIINSIPVSCDSRESCEDNKKLKYVWGDALQDASNCLGPKGTPYPTSTISKIFRRSAGWGNSRKGRSYGTIDPLVTQRTLLKNYQVMNDMDEKNFFSRTRRDYGSQDTCMGTPSRLCKTRYNTTAPMYGVSLTSGQPVTIVQKFPDLLQQVVYEVCESGECDVVRGECTQTYVPYLFLVIPLGPVTLTGQDYVLVESGCVCKPKYASTTISEPNSMSAIPNL